MASPGSVNVTTTPVASEGPVLRTVAVSVIASPATTGSGVSVNARTRSLSTKTVVVSTSVSLAAVGSGVVVLTASVAVSVDASVTSEGTVVTMSKTASVPGARAPAAQVTVWAAAPYVQPAAATNTTSAGRATTSSVAVAVDAPVLVTRAV